MYRNFFRIGFPEVERGLLDNLNSRLFRLLEDEVGSPSRSYRAIFPSVNIYDSDKDYMIEAELAGMDKDDIDIQVSGNKITISGELKDNMVENMSYHRKERSFGKFSRTFTLPEDVDNEKIEAEFVNGILRVKVGKSEKALPKKIEIKTN